MAKLSSSLLSHPSEALPRDLHVVTRNTRRPRHLYAVNSHLRFCSFLNKKRLVGVRRGEQVTSPPGARTHRTGTRAAVTQGSKDVCILRQNEGLGNGQSSDLEWLVVL